MFERRAAKSCVRKAVDAIIDGAFFGRSDADTFPLNDYARAYLYTEAVFHQFHALKVLFDDTFGRTQWWASPDFLWQEISDELEKKKSKIGPVAMSRCDEIDALSPERRRAGDHVRDSAERIAEIDPNADKELVARTIAKATESFLATFRPLIEHEAQRRPGLFS